MVLQVMHIMFFAETANYIQLQFERYTLYWKLMCVLPFLGNAAIFPSLHKIYG